MSIVFAVTKLSIFEALLRGITETGSDACNLAKICAMYLSMNKRYSDEQVKSILATLTANRGNVGQTARELAVPATSIRRLRDQAAVQFADALTDGEKISIAQTRNYVALYGDLQVEIAAKLRERMHDKRTTFRDLAIALGIASDKMLDHRDGRRGSVEVNINQEQRIQTVIQAIIQLREVASDK